MKSYEISYCGKTLYVNANLEVVQYPSSKDVAAHWKSNDNDIWECHHEHSSICFSQLVGNQEYLPTKIIFFLSNRCNLNCIYCYSKYQSKNSILSIHDCVAVIDKMVKLLVRVGRRTLKIKFHGGGEPFMSFDLMKDIAKYAKEVSQQESLKLQLDVSTNGLLSQEQRACIIKNIKHLNISCDGSEYLQRINRPAKNQNLDTYHELKKTISFFESKDFPFTLRTTITSTNLDNIKNIIHELNKLSKTARKKMELVYKKNYPKHGFKLNQNIELSDYLNSYYYAKHNIDQNIMSFDACDSDYIQCGAWGDNLILDGEHNISTCYKYTSLGDQSPFYMGKLSDFLEHPILLPSESTLIKIIEVSNKSCAYCFLWKACGGGCLVLRNMKFENPYCNYLRTFFFKRLYYEAESRQVCPSCNN